MISLLVLSNASGRFNTSRGGLTLAYWHLDTDGPNISGELVDPHIAEGVAQNFLFTNKWLEPCSDRFGSVLFNLPMDAGTSLSGLLGSSGGNLTISGRTTDWLRDYTISMSLTRVS